MCHVDDPRAYYMVYPNDLWSALSFLERYIENYRIGALVRHMLKCTADNAGFPLKYSVVSTTLGCVSYRCDNAWPETHLVGSVLSRQ